MKHGRNKNMLLRNTKSLINSENLKILNSELETIYYSPKAWEYYN